MPTRRSRFTTPRVRAKCEGAARTMRWRPHLACAIFSNSLAEVCTRKARRRPLAELLRTIFDDSGYLAFCAGLDDGEQRVANLQFLHEQAAKFDAFHRQGLPRFLAFLQSLENWSLDLERAPVASEADDVVRIMTIHRAKGLQFPVVIVPDLGKRINLQDTQGSLLVDRTHGLGLDVVDAERYIRYRSLAGSLVESGIRRRVLAEELRVLYVAMTRAKEHLILIGTVGKNRLGGLAGSSGRVYPGQAMAAETVLSAEQHGRLDRPGGGERATIAGGGPAFEVIAYSPEESAEMDVAATARGPADNGRLARNWRSLGPILPARRFRGQAASRRNSQNASPAAIPVCRDRETAGGQVRHRHRQAGPAGEIARAIRSTPGRLCPQTGTARLSSIPSAAPLATEAAARPRTWSSSISTFAGPKHQCGNRSANRRILIAAKRITPEQAAMVDRPAIAWVLTSEAGQLLQKRAGRFLREIPVYFPIGPKGVAIHESDPYDRTMVRGRTRRIHSRKPR